MRRATAWGKKNLEGRKWPMVLIDEGGKERTSGVYFLDERAKSLITTMVKGKSHGGQVADVQ